MKTEFRWVDYICSILSFNLCSHLKSNYEFLIFSILCTFDLKIIINFKKQLFGIGYPAKTNIGYKTDFSNWTSLSLFFFFFFFWTHSSRVLGTLYTFSGSFIKFPGSFYTFLWKRKTWKRGQRGSKSIFFGALNETFRGPDSEKWILKFIITLKSTTSIQ